jgi:hypothetical protein
MGLWYRVFGTNDAQPVPAALLEHLRSLGIDVTGNFRGDDQGWFGAELGFATDATPVHLERFLSTEEGIRNDLNSWAAWLETADYSPNHRRLMGHVISTTQLFTLRRPIDHPNEILVDRVCVGVCQYLARETAGVYQVDDQGFFAPDGALLLQEF